MKRIEMTYEIFACNFFRASATFRVSGTALALRRKKEAVAIGEERTNRPKGSHQSRVTRNERSEQF
jgi:hypothetical protein